MIRALMFMLVAPVTAGFDHYGAVTDGFVHAAVADVLKEPIENAIRPDSHSYYICIDSNHTFQKKCYTDVFDYKIITPPSTLAIIISNVFILLVLVSSVMWCFTSSVEEKGDFCSYIICYIVGRIIYDILCGDDDD